MRDPLDPDLTITLPFSVWQTISTHLQRGPYSEVVGLLNALAAQILPQTEAAYAAYQKEQATAEATVAAAADKRSH
jgi:hypothetical protein